VSTATNAKPWWETREVRVTAETRLIGIRKVMDRLDLGKTALYDGIKKKRIPPPVKLGANNRWPEDEITELQARLIAARQANPTTPASS